jgi:signal peptidase I
MGEIMKNWLKNNRSYIVFMCCFGFFRLAIADWNPIPSGSMRPTLLEGDVVLVNRVAYDFKLPLTEQVLVEWWKCAMKCSTSMAWLRSTRILFRCRSLCTVE